MGLRKLDARLSSSHMWGRSLVMAMAVRGGERF